MMRILLLLLCARLAAAFVLPSPLSRRHVSLSVSSGVIELAQNQIDGLRKNLGSSTRPEELKKLEADIKRKDATQHEIGISMFNLLITMTLDYDNIDGIIEPAIDLPEVLPQSEEMRQKMTYLYTYGMRMNASDLLSLDDLKDAILNRIASRVGLSGEELDDWLDV